MQQNNYQKSDSDDIFQQALLTKRINIPMTLVDKFIYNTLSEILTKEIEGKCCVDGYIKPNSVKINTYSSGLITGSNISFDVVFECLICLPVEGMVLNVRAVSINTAGIKAESVRYSKTDELSVASGGTNPTPYVLFVSRNHHQDNEIFNSIKVNDTFIAKVIVQRFELNDKYISIIGEIDTK
jgi:DNA-directed RNA polymerase subunit E'/Rpb7